MEEVPSAGRHIPEGEPTRNVPACPAPSPERKAGASEDVERGARSVPRGKSLFMGTRGVGRKGAAHRALGL